MWARSIVMTLGLWLMASPYFLQPEPQAGVLYASVQGLIVVVLSGFAMTKKFEKTAVLIFFHALYLSAKGRFGFDHPQPPMAQNLIIIGILIAMLIIIPLRSLEPPFGREKGMYKVRKPK